MASLRQARCAIDLFYKELFEKDHDIAFIGREWEKRAAPDIPSQAEVLKILGGVENTIYRLALYCIYGMGLELNEALKLKVRHIDFQQNFVEIPSIRGRKQRQAILPITIRESLASLTSTKAPDDFLFGSKSGGPYSEKSLQRAFSKAKRLAQIPESYTIRSLRYAYVKHLEFLGIPLSKVIDHLGLKGFSFDFYSTIGYPDIEVTFSPIDRRLSEAEEKYQPESTPYVSEERLDGLSTLLPPKIDLTRLLSILRELNIAYRHNLFMSIAMLVRSVIDHVPPIFGYTSFNEVVNNYPSTKSFKKSMEHLNSSLRNIADAHLHAPIRHKESLPTFTQVDFRADLDVLLGEVVRVLK
jgi:hypothetical protein